MVYVLWNIVRRYVIDGTRFNMGLAGRPLGATDREGCARTALTEAHPNFYALPTMMHIIYDGDSTLRGLRGL